MLISLYNCFNNPSYFGIYAEVMRDFAFWYIGEKYLVISKTFLLIFSVDIKKWSVFVSVGAWSLPETMIFFAQNAPIAQIVGIDTSSEAVYIGGEILQSLWYWKLISMRNIDGEKYNYINADIVYICLSLSNKNAVLKRVEETVSSWTQIIISIPIGLTKLFYEDISPDLFPSLELQKTIKTDHTYSWRSLVKMVKK